MQFVSQWDRCSEVLSLWISHYKGTGEKKRVRRSLYNAVLQAGFPKVALSLKVSLRLVHHVLPSTECGTSSGTCLAGGSLNNTLLMPSGMGLYGNLNISTFGLTA